MSAKPSEWRPEGWDDTKSIQDYYTGRLANAENPWQGGHHKVLCVCTAGLLRAPTAAVVLSQDPFNFNTRAAGIEPSFALVPVDPVLLVWANEIVCMTSEHEEKLLAALGEIGIEKKITCLHIPDTFGYRDPELMRMIRERYEESP